MKKLFLGVPLRRLRAERHLTQVAMAKALGLSPSYLNQIEQNQRPLTLPVLLKVNQVLGVELHQSCDEDVPRMVAAMGEALADAADPVTLPELQWVATHMPALGRAVLALHRRRVEALQRIESLSLLMGDDRSELAVATDPASVVRSMPFEVVRDFFFAHRNHFDALDRGAEALAATAAAAAQPLPQWLRERLLNEHSVQVVVQDAALESKRRFVARTRTLYLERTFRPSQMAFQMATQIALLEATDTIDRLTDVPVLAADAAARKLARIGLANYFAGALLLPYTTFLEAAEGLRYDIDLLGQRFGVGFETICHRLSTLQRPAAPGVPFFFVRVDRAGNISKRQSATHFHFSRTGGTCPLWNVYEAFGQPERILRQLARMPDGRTYLWIARTVFGPQGGYGVPRQTFSVGLGCDVSHAHRLVYAKGLDTRDLDAATRIGMGCKVCERERCPQRAFPFIGRPLDVDENVTRVAPYGFERPRQTWP